MLKIVQKLAGFIGVAALFATTVQAQYRSAAFPPRISHQAMMASPVHDSPLHCAAVELHEAVLLFQTRAERFAPSHAEVHLANDLVPAACSLVDATECGVTWAETLCEVRKMQSQLARMEAQLDRYCAPQLHPAFADQWNCVVRAWTDVMHNLEPPVNVSSQLHAPTPAWNDPRVQTPGFNAAIPQFNHEFAQPRYNALPVITSQRPNIERNYRNDFRSNPFEAARGGYVDPRQVGPQPGDIGMALASTILRRLLER